MNDSKVERKTEERRTALSLLSGVVVTLAAIAVVALGPPAPWTWMAGVTVIFVGTRLEHWYFSPHRRK